MTPHVRPAQKKDVEAVAAFTTATFAWGDYVADSMTDWLDDPDTKVVVACDDDDRPVALARVRMLGAREGWISAARVHPDHRRRGLASVLNDWCVGWIASRGGMVARLQIETWNEPACRQVEGLGYRAVARVLNAQRHTSTGKMAPVTNGGKRKTADERLDRAPRGEAEGAFIAWSTGDLAKAAHGLFPVDRWAWRRLSPDDITTASTWFCPSGWVVAHDEADELTVRWMVSTPDDASSLLRATVDLAVEREASGVHVVVPAVDWLEKALQENGFELVESRVYEKAV